MTGKGRRPGNPDTKETILDSARTRFAGHGFKGTSIRQIAAEAGVDPALVHHYFGSKDQLFLATIAVPIDPHAVIGPVLAAGPEDFGRHLVATLVRVWDSESGTALVAAFRAALSDPKTSTLVREFVTSTIFSMLAAVMHLAPDEAQRRASLIGTQMTGLIVGRYLLAFEPIRSMPPADVVAAIGPVVQHYLAGDLGGPVAAVPQSGQGEIREEPR
jgi:AcrR family transcriptional regulator